MSISVINANNAHHSWPVSHIHKFVNGNLTVIEMSILRRNEIHLKYSFLWFCADYCPRESVQSIAENTLFWVSNFISASPLKRLSIFGLFTNWCSVDTFQQWCNVHYRLPFTVSWCVDCGFFEKIKNGKFWSGIRDLFTLYQWTECPVSTRKIQK